MTETAATPKARCESADRSCAGFFRRAVWVVLFVGTLGITGCGDDGDGTGPVPAVTVEQSLVTVPGHVPEPNPETGTETPAEANRARALVFQARGVSDAEIEQVLVLMPGFLAGANTFEYMARRLVTRSAGKTAVWAVDRRSNALEDQAGFDAAERDGDPDIAKGYYFRDAEVDGRRFAGLLTENGTDISYLAEWGIRAHVEDLDALVEEMADRYPQASLFLGGHSLGASIAPIYAAWDFGGRVGFHRLSGLILIEGGPQPALPGEIPSREAYETTGIEAGLSSSSLASIRMGNPTSSIPFVERDLFLAAEVVAMRASSRLGEPGALSPDLDIIGGFYRLIFGLPTLPQVTNRGALGFGFDNDFQPLGFVQAAIGEAIGPVGPNRSLVAQIFGADTLAPTDPSAIYDWRRPADQALPEVTDTDTFAEMLFSGPSNFVEWYFPARITLDVAVTSSLNVGREGDWRRQVYGMAVTENAGVDLPVYAVGGSIGLAPGLDRFDRYRASISPRLRNGTSRSASAAGFVARILEGYAHIDPVTADDSGAGNAWFQALLDWMAEAEALAPRLR